MRHDRLRRRLEGMYGDWDPAESSSGVVHVASVWQDAPEHWRVIDIGPHAPQSPHDRFALDLARTRADVIVTTGAIMRAEPELHYDLRSDLAEDLARWRVEHRSPHPPTVVLLTSGRDLDFAHPMFHSWARPVVFTTWDAATSLRTHAPPQVEIVGVTHPTARGLLEWAQNERGAQAIVIEAGVRTTEQLYEPPGVVDELMLSVFEGSSIHPHARGRSFVSPAHIELDFDEPRPAHRIEEPSGPWSFHRYLRKVNEPSAS